MVTCYICWYSCRSSKSVLPSLAKNHTLLVNSQIRWRTDVRQHWSNVPRSSALVGSQPLQKSNKVIQLLGAQKKVTFTREQFNMIQDVHGSYDTEVSVAFREFRNSYLQYVKDCQRNQTKPTPFSTWQVGAHLLHACRCIIYLSRFIIHPHG